MCVCVCMCVQSKINRSTEYTHTRSLRTHTRILVPVYPVPNSATGTAGQACPSQPGKEEERGRKSWRRAQVARAAQRKHRQIDQSARGSSRSRSSDANCDRNSDVVLLLFALCMRASVFVCVCVCGYVRVCYYVFMARQVLFLPLRRVAASATSFI